MKTLLTSLVFFSISVAAETNTASLSIQSGPFVVPIEVSKFNPIGTDFKATGKAIVLVGEKKLIYAFTDEEAQFTRTDVMTVATTPDDDFPEYLVGRYGPGKKSVIRIGFETLTRDTLTWLHTQNDVLGSVRIVNNEKIGASGFSELKDETLEMFAEYFCRDFGNIEGGGIRRGTDGTAVFHAALLDEDESENGEITVTFLEKEIRIIAKTNE